MVLQKEATDLMVQYCYLLLVKSLQTQAETL